MSYKMYLDLLEGTYQAKWWYNLLDAFRNQESCKTFEDFLKSFGATYRTGGTTWAGYLEFDTDEDAAIFMLRIS